MAWDKVITWDAAKLERFKKAYKTATGLSMPEFNFEGDLFVTSYAKYLIEYLETALKPEPGQ